MTVVAVEIVTSDDDGKQIDPPRILLPDGKLISPAMIGNNGFLFMIDVDRLEVTSR